MNPALYQSIVPAQVAGGEVNVVLSLAATDTMTTDALYEQLKLALLAVSQWNSLMNGITAEFVLTDRSGNPVTRQAKVRDHLRIRIPGPGLPADDGYDWVQIESMEERQWQRIEFFFVTVRPVANPQDDQTSVAHFLQGGASTTFMIIKAKNSVRFEVHCRNEVPNNQIQGVLNQFRNRLTGFFAGIGFSKWQWTKLGKALCKAAVARVELQETNTWQSSQAATN